MQKGKKPRPQTLRHRRIVLPLPEVLEARRLLSACATVTARSDLASLLPAVQTSTVAGYSPDQIRQAYAIDQVPADGEGQTIAIVDAYNDPDIKCDLSVFDAQFGISAPPSFRVVSQTGSDPSKIPTNPSWSAEAALDVEWAHAIAPGANILLVEAKNSDLSNLLAGVDYARNVANVSVVSMSWGGSEFAGQTSYDSLFTTPAGHMGVTFVAASGDTFGAEWPAGSPDVLSVGGTTMDPIASNLGNPRETPWAMSSHSKSTIEREPAYQHAVQQVGSRIIPDVALNANPDTGYAVYDSVANHGKTGWQVVGGSSAAAPQWGAFIAIADQLRVASNLGTLDGASQTLPAIYQSAADPATYVAGFDGIVGTFYSSHGATPADAGLGTPRAQGLIETLAQQPSDIILLPSIIVSGSAADGATGHAAPSALGRPASVEIAGFGPPPNPISVSAATTSQLLPASSVAASPSVQPTVFNEVLIHHPGAALSASGPGRIELSAAVESQHVGALTLANATGFAGELTVGLASWLAGNGAGGSGNNDLLMTSPRHSLAGAVAAAFPIAAGVVSSANIVAAMGAPLARAPASILYRFANFDPVGTFADSLADFARESASIGPAEVRHSSHRALIVTMVVLGVDMMLAANWYNERKKSQKQTAQSMEDER